MSGTKTDPIIFSSSSEEETPEDMAYVGGNAKVLTTKRAKKTVQSDTFQGNSRANSTYRREAKISKKGIYPLAFEFSRFTSKMGPGDFRTARKNDAEQTQRQLLMNKSQK